MNQSEPQTNVNPISQDLYLVKPHFVDALRLIRAIALGVQGNSKGEI
ncbi:hypothetical protein HC931_27775 [Candidatus Gracilibacteria bacterium]|nr:hypothetical protein [Candidatus Gracilibacteria bacterium]NJM90264.1 hypothetical protein [Hydrococcus sp. RU_2_2]NJP22122.1 hypothetical protein [Hydrococcus sp. CRU_1_1]NJQ98199.1 hypothetical protein [Hydrococcus sp. CSU_1_8]